MRGDAKSMTVLTPRTPKEAVALFSREPKALPLAGGPDHGKGRGRVVDHGLHDLAVAQAQQTRLLGIDDRATPQKEVGIQSRPGPHGVQRLDHGKRTQPRRAAAAAPLPQAPALVSPTSSREARLRGEVLPKA